MIVFANPAFLWALAAAAVPLMLHMFQRRRTVVTPFPTVRFLKAAQKNSSSRVRFENFFLWLLRTLLMIMIALAFALPVIRNSTNTSGWLTRSNRDIALVIDGSYSMNYELDRGKAWDVCKNTAAQIIGGLQSGDRVCVYIAAETPTPVIEKPTAEHATVVQEIRNQNCPTGTSNLEDAIGQAVQALEQVEGRREKEIYILTDGQALPWSGFRELDPDDAAAKTNAPPKDAVTASAQKKKLTREQKEKIAFYVMMAGAEQPDNAGVTAVKVAPSLLLAGQNARVAVKVMRSGPAKQISVGLTIDGQNRGSRNLDAEPGAEGTTEFIVSGLDSGIHTAKITVPQDALPVDDEFQFLLRVRKQLPALIAGPRESARYLKAALAPGASDDSVLLVDSSELEATDLRSYQALFLCDAFPLSGQAIIRIEEYVKNGGTVVVFPGSRTDESAYKDIAILPAQPKAVESIPVDLAARQLRRIPNKPDQVVSFNLSLPPGTVPVVALKRVQTFGDLAEGAAVLVVAGLDSPFMLGRAVGRGRVFQFAVSADREWSTFPVTAIFLPIVHQLIRVGAGAAVQPPYLHLGSNIPAEESIPAFRSDDTILSPSGIQVSIKDNGNRTYMIESLTEPGIYTRNKVAGTEPEPVLAVNTDRTESNLTPVSAAELTEWLKIKKLVIARDPEEFLRLIEEFRNGRSLAEIFLWIVALLALLEWSYANYVLRKKTGAMEKMKIDITGKVS